MNLLEGDPDLGSGFFMTVNYDNALDQLVVDGYVTAYSGPTSFGLLGNWNLTAEISDVSGGTLVDGTLLAYDDASNLILQGSLLPGLSGPSGAFGFPDYPASDPALFEFLFIVDGGILADDFGGIGSTGGIRLNAYADFGDVPFTGDWNADFSYAAGGFNSDANTFMVEAVPEPSSMTLIFLGLVFSAVSRHRATALSSTLRGKS